MRLLTGYDTGGCPSYTPDDDEIVFDPASPNETYRFDAVIEDAPAEFDVVLRIDGEGTGLLGQGLVTSTDGGGFEICPVTEDADGWLRATVPAPSGSVRIATQYPYGRDRLDALLCDVPDAAADGVDVSASMHRAGNRSVPMVRFGDATAETVHYVVVEDAPETAACYAVDEMIRRLLQDDALRERLTDGAAIHLSPLLSPYSSGAIYDLESGAVGDPPWFLYATPDGHGMYAAAAWGEETPPPEWAWFRERVVNAIETGRLGLLLTMHSYGGERARHDLETIRTAGERSLSNPRIEWAERTMATFADGVSALPWEVSETVWQEGLARDHLLKEHDAATFRMEVSTHEAVVDGTDDFRAIGNDLLENIAHVDSWEGTLGE